jgi:transposase
MPVLQQEGKRRNDTAWFWQYSKPGCLVYFDYQDSRSRAGPSHFLSDCKGRLQTGGYEVYTALGLNLQSHAGCWAHARRKFDQARKAAPKQAPCQESQEMLDLIAKLYAEESEAREAQLDAPARLQLRQERGVTAQTRRSCQADHPDPPAGPAGQPARQGLRLPAQSMETLLRFRYRWCG